MSEQPTPEQVTKCACPREDARDCYRYRYAPMDDLQRADFFSIMDEHDDKCECPCHDEYEDGYDDFI